MPSNFSLCGLFVGQESGANAHIAHMFAHRELLPMTMIRTPQFGGWRPDPVFQLRQAEMITDRNTGEH